MNKSDLDIDSAKKLIHEIAVNVATRPESSAKYMLLVTEVDELKLMLDRADIHDPMIENQMKSVHGLFDKVAVELRAESIQAGVFLTEIGHMLGLE